MLSRERKAELAGVEVIRGWVEPDSSADTNAERFLNEILEAMETARIEAMPEEGCGEDQMHLRELPSGTVGYPLPKPISGDEKTAISVHAYIAGFSAARNADIKEDYLMRRAAENYARQIAASPDGVGEESE